MSKKIEEKELLSCPFGQPHWCDEKCALLDVDEDSCCIRVAVRALEDIADYCNAKNPNRP